MQHTVIAAIKVGGQLLDALDDGIVQLPFGSEYSIVLKNLNPVRAQFQLAIDGDDATSHTWIVIQPNAEIEMERFIKNGNWASGNRFKFVERTKTLEATRGKKVDDGIVRVEVQVERVRPVVDVPVYREYDVLIPRYYYPPYPYRRRSVPMAAASGGRMRASSRSIGASAGVGITRPGGHSNQSFHATDGFQTGPSQILLLHLRGIVARRQQRRASVAMAR